MEKKKRELDPEKMLNWLKFGVIGIILLIVLVQIIKELPSLLR